MPRGASVRSDKERGVADSSRHANLAGGESKQIRPDKLARGTKSSAKSGKVERAETAQKTSAAAASPPKTATTKVRASRVSAESTSDSGRVTKAADIHEPVTAATAVSRTADRTSKKQIGERPQVEGTSGPARHTDGKALPDNAKEAKRGKVGSNEKGDAGAATPSRAKRSSQRNASSSKSQTDKNAIDAPLRSSIGEDKLSEYERKRDFGITSEPSGREEKSARTRSKPAVPTIAQFVIQKHDARRLHYDFRLELDGTLKSWAVPKGPSLDPAIKRLAVHVEDHPISYAGFEGSIPEGQYGAGDVIVWDRGEWQSADADPLAAYRAGKMKFHLLGEKLSGGWTLVRTRLPGNGDKEQWLLIKEDDAAARRESEFDITVARPESVLSHAQLPEKKRTTKRNAAAGSENPIRSPKANASSGSEAKRRTSFGALPEGAKPAPLPDRLSPELATLVEEAPPGTWLYEVKYDGYRIMARAEGKKIQLFTRNGHDWSSRLPDIADAVAKLGLTSGWLDGEIVIFDDEGIPDFQALQNAFEGGRRSDIVYCLFDMPYHEGLDLTATPLETRRRLLQELLSDKPSACLRFSEDISAKAEDILKTACEIKLEGVIGKRAGSSYVSRRSNDWIKLKCKQRQEFVIGGHSRPQGSRSGFGALLLGVHDGNGALKYVGRVGTGFTDSSLRSLYEKMAPLAQTTCPFTPLVKGREAAGVTWLNPTLICEVEFAAWTGEGKVRHAAFRGLREDKPANTIAREAPKSAAEVSKVDPPVAGSARARKKTDKPEVEGIKISHPDRVIDPESGATKIELVEFYRDIALHFLPHLVRRPLGIVRVPEGITGEQFFQRHVGTLGIPGIVNHPSGNEQLMEVPSVQALIGAAQMGTIEFHTWNATVDDLEKPDRMIFDLDPDPTLPWQRVVEGTHLVLAVLDELGLKSYLKTSGGKGMHVVVPIKPELGWTAIKEFSRAVTQHLARQLPQRFADRMGPKNRVGKIFVDYLRNQKGGTTVSAFSVRARPGLGVSVPISKEELDEIAGASQWTLRNARERLASLRDDPWAEYASTQSITSEMMERLGL